MTSGPLADSRVQRGLYDLRTSREQMRRAIASLSDREMKTFGVDFFDINFATVFGRRRTRGALRALARAAVRSRIANGWWFCKEAFEAGHGRPSAIGPGLMLDGWPPALVEALVHGRGRHWIYVAHFGAFRLVTLDLVAIARDVTLALDHDSAVHTAALLRNCGVPEADGAFDFAAAPGGLRRRGRLRLVDVEHDAGAGVRLVRASRANAVVVAFGDGHSGRGGPWAERNRTPTRLFSHPISIRSGVFELAAWCDAQRYALFPRFDGDGTASLHGVHALPAAGLSTVVTAFVQALERAIECRPEQWEGAKLFHRWRVVAPPDDRAPRGPRVDAAARLRGGARVRPGPQTVPFVTSAEVCLVDIRTLRGYALPHVASAAGWEAWLQGCTDRLAWNDFRNCAPDEAAVIAREIEPLRAQQLIAVTGARRRAVRAAAATATSRPD